MQINTIGDMAFAFSLFSKRDTAKVILALSEATELAVYQIKDAVGDPYYSGTVSVTLKRLKKWGIVTSRRFASFTFYRLVEQSDPHVYNVVHSLIKLTKDARDG